MDRTSPELDEAQDAPPRLCAFCGAPYSARMNAWMGEPLPCACCGGEILAHWPIKPQPVRAQDLACDACGKVLYRAPENA